MPGSERECYMGGKAILCVGVLVYEAAGEGDSSFRA